MRNVFNSILLTLVFLFCINSAQQVSESVGLEKPDRFVLRKGAQYHQNFECRVSMGKQIRRLAYKLCFRDNTYKARATSETLARGEGDTYLKVVNEASGEEEEKDLEKIRSIEVVRRYGSKFYVKETDGRRTYFWVKITEHDGDVKYYLVHPKLAVSFYYLDEKTRKEEALSHPYLHRVDKIENIRRVPVGKS